MTPLSATAPATPSSPGQAAVSTAPGWRRGLGTLAGVALGLVLLVAAWAKALDPQAFARDITAQGIAGASLAPAVALAALGLEVALGLALVLGVRRLWVLLPAALLVACFLFLTGRAYWLDLHGRLPAEAGCGCFGNLVERSPAEAFWQDLALLAPALLLAFVGRARGARSFPPLRTAAVAVGTAAVLVFAWKAPDLPLDDFATRLKPGVSLAALCAGAGETRTCLDTVVPELTEGEHTVILADLDATAFQESVAALNGFVAGPGSPSLLVLTDKDKDAQQAFYWRFGPVFELREVPAPLLRPLYRRLPRTFMVRDGRVTRTFRGLPPLSPEADRTAAVAAPPPRDRSRGSLP